MIDINKKYKTRSGLPVRILCTDRKAEPYTVVALVSSSKTAEKLTSYTEDGQYFRYDGPSEYDLVEILPLAVGDLVMCWGYIPSVAHLRKFAAMKDGKYETMCGRVYDNCMPLEDYVMEYM